MKSVKTLISNIIMIIAVFAADMTYILWKLWGGAGVTAAVSGWFVLVVGAVIASPAYPKLNSKRLIVLQAGRNHLQVFIVSCVLVLFPYIVLVFDNNFSDGKIKVMLLSLVFTVIAEAVIFWSGMLRVFFTSEQLAVKWRVIAVVCGFIPVVNIVVLIKMLKIVGAEIEYENERLGREISRRGQELCKTRYPLFMVHGIFFRDFEYVNYWGRIPKALEENGATIFYGKHQSSESVEECARELTERLKDICSRNGFDKVNVIAHSKGGLDMRHAISRLGADKYVASLTTINTPHRGCEYADYLLDKVPPKQQQMIAHTYNSTFARLGDEKPDFLKGVSNLTRSFCEKFNEETPDKEGVYYQSFGSRQKNAVSGRFPLNMSYLLVKYFDGDNDGLVGEKSFRWGSDYHYITSEGSRGISHADMIDLNRENIPGFDVREFYIDLVHRLKEKGF